MVLQNVVGTYDGVSFPPGTTSQSTSAALDIGAALESYTGPTPGWITAPAVPATGVAVTNTHGMTAAVTFLTAGTQSAAVQVNGNPVTAASGATAFQTVFVPPQGTITLTYSVAPTWEWMLVN